MNLFQKYRRWRHGKGFGVHSPLAYELITSSLTDYPPYYIDDEIGRRLPGERNKRIGRILIRLISKFRPQSVFMESMFSPVASIADSRIRVSESPFDCDMAVETQNGVTTVRVGECATDRGPLVLENRKDLRIVIYREGLSRCTVLTTL